MPPPSLLEALPSVLEGDEEECESDCDDETSPSSPSSSISEREDKNVFQRTASLKGSMLKDMDGWGASAGRRHEFVRSSSTASSSSSSSSDTNDDSAGDDEDLTQDYKQFMNTEYGKYFLMLKAGVPKQWVVKACEVDGRDTSVLDNPQILLLSKQTEETEATEETECLDEDESESYGYNMEDSQDIANEEMETEDCGNDDELSEIDEDDDYQLNSEPSPTGASDQGQDSVQEAVLLRGFTDAKPLPGSSQESDSLKEAGLLRGFGDLEQPSGSESHGKCQDDNNDEEEKKENECPSEANDKNEEQGGGLLGFIFGWGRHSSDPSSESANATHENQSSQAEEPEESVARESNISCSTKQPTDQQAISSSDLGQPIGDANSEQAGDAADHDCVDTEEPLPFLYRKYLLMLRAGTNVDRVRLLVELDGKDPTILLEHFDKADSNAESKYVTNTANRPLPVTADVEDPSAVAQKAKSKTTTKSKAEDTEVLKTKTESDKVAIAKSKANEKEDTGVPLMRDPRFARYFLMLKARVPKDRVRQVVEMDGKDPTVLDLDPNRSYSSQVVEEVEEEPVIQQSDNKDVVDNSALRQYGSNADSQKSAIVARVAEIRKRGSISVTDAAVQQDENARRVARDTKKSNIAALMASRQSSRAAPAENRPLGDGSVERSENNTNSNGKVNVASLFARRAEMAGVAAKKAPLVVITNDSDTGKGSKKVADLQGKAIEMEESCSGNNATPTGSPLKDDSEYQKYFKMLKLGLPLGAVKQAMVKDGKDSTILDLDPNKPLGLQRVQAGASSSPLKDSPEYQKYFKMLKMGLPLGAAKQAMTKDGKDCTILDLDPNKPIGIQRPAAMQSPKIANKAKPTTPTVVRKRLFWNSIEESNLRGSLWEREQQSDRSLDLNGLEYDEEEFASLFTLVTNEDKVDNKSNIASPKSKQNIQRQQKKSIQLIDSRRQMNGSILLAKYKHDYKVLARKVNNMDPHGMCETELLALMQLLPSKDEALAIRSYLPADEGPIKDDAISKLGECEKYMVAMLAVDEASSKLKCMKYRIQFKSLVDSVSSDVESLRAALTCVRNSDRLARLMLFALRLGNTLNTGGSGKDVSAITLDSLLKLQEAKAFDKKTSVLHYLVKILEKNDKDVLKVSQDLVPALKAERITLDSLTKSLGDLQEGLASTKNMSASGDKTAMTTFVREADERLTRLLEDFQKCKQTSLDVLKYFGEDQKKPLNEFFTTLARFIAMFESARAEVQRLEEVKARKERRSKTKSNATTSPVAAAGQDPTQLGPRRSAVLHDIMKRGSTM